MNLDENVKEAVQNLGNAINAAVEQSTVVRTAIDNLRELGFEPNLTLKLEIGLQEILENIENFSDEIELDLTDEDVKTLRRMKIKF
jgi:anti-sigma regulatory factor (Ser/Thr protein kinase)